MSNNASRIQDSRETPGSRAGSVLEKHSSAGRPTDGIKKEIFDELGLHRAQLGCKPQHAATERLCEARRLTSLFQSQGGFSFVRLGDFEVAYLLAAEHGAKEDIFPSDNIVSGTAGLASPGLEIVQAARLRAALEQADYLDSWDCQWKDDAMLARLALRRAPGTMGSPDRACSFILPAWLEHEFKHFCENRRVLFCGAEAPLLEELLKQAEFRERAAQFWPEQCNAFFLPVRENGRNLGRNLDLIKRDLAMAISKWKIDALFLSLGGGAKILCHELARECGICAIDFGAFLRSLTYSGSDGNRANRSVHTVFLFRVPFGPYMDALEKVFPALTPEELLAKAHAQLLLEVQAKEVGWSHTAWENDFSAENKANFKQSLREYKHRYKKLINKSKITRKERADFLHFCGTHKLSWEGRFFLAKFRVKSALARLSRKGAHLRPSSGRQRKS
jgi:hypothetical protein